MANLKYYNSVTEEWETLVVGKQGPTGPQGVPGNDGALSPNAVINGAFDIWQRGTSFTTGAASSLTFSADRWIYFNYGTNTGSCTQETFSPGTAPVAGYEGSFFARFNSTSTANFFQSRIEDVRTLAGQTATLSFFAKSGSAQTLTVNVNQNFGSGGSSQVVIQNTVSLTTSWARYTITVSLASLSGKTIGTGSFVTLEFAGAANNAVDIWGVQLEAGPTANVFRRNANSLAGELAACQRYFYRMGGDSAFEILGQGSAVSGTETRFGVTAPVTMRTAPTSLSFSNVAAYDVGGANIIPATNVTLGLTGKTSLGFIITVASGLTTQRPLLAITNNSLTGFLAFSAEL